MLKNRVVESESRSRTFLGGIGGVVVFLVLIESESGVGVVFLDVQELEPGVGIVFVDVQEWESELKSLLFFANLTPL